MSDSDTFLDCFRIRFRICLTYRIACPQVGTVQAIPAIKNSDTIMRSKKPHLAKGAAAASDIYISMGVALSWWEASEDILMGLFKQLCGVQEPTAFETYVASPRGRRQDMLNFAFRRYRERFIDGELEDVRRAMKELDKLAAVRNEIAHGHCSSVNATENGKAVMSGHYLLPSLNESGWHERSHRYAHTAETMNAFTARVRKQRGIVIDVLIALMKRDQQSNVGILGVPL